MAYIFPKIDGTNASLWLDNGEVQAGSRTRKLTLENETGFSSKNIPQLLNMVYYDIVKEECWNFVKENRNPIINFRTLQYFVFIKVKEKMNHLF